jgi:type I restriction enzyme, S subunit
MWMRCWRRWSESLPKSATSGRPPIRTDPDRICGSFLSYLIRREEDQVLRLVTGTTVFHLYGADMKKFTFAMPSIEEQRAICAVLSDVDAVIAALEQRRDKTRALKQAMMQELLTGKTRLVPPEGRPCQSNPAPNG